MNKRQLYVVGIGPGAYEEMTIRAARVLAECQTIVGYPVYVDLIKPYFSDKEYLTTPMTKEADRCHLAFQKAAAGVKTALICSGDSGIYGLSGLVLELAPQYPLVSVEIVPGVTAASAGSAILGAALTHDFSVISLSDLLTPWEKIEARLDCAAKSDMVIAIYNPASKKRRDYLERACDILLRHKTAETICAMVRNISRDGEESSVMTLKELRSHPADMFTAVFIGNSQTKNINGKMVTPRGYRYV